MINTLFGLPKASSAGFSYHFYCLMKRLAFTCVVYIHFFKEVFNKLEEIPHVGNSTLLEKLKNIAENTTREHVFNWVVILAIVGVVFSLLTFAIVYKAKSHKRRYYYSISGHYVFNFRENRWKKSSFQERKCSSCRSLSCEHRSFTNFNR